MTMLATTFEQLFAPAYVGGMAMRFAQDVPTPYLDLFKAGERLAPPDQSVAWDEVELSRDTATLVGNGAPSVGVRKVTDTPRAGTIIEIAEHVDLPPRYLYQLRAPGMPIAEPAAKLALEVKNLTNKVMRTANMVCARALLSQGNAVDLSALPNSQLKGSVTWPVKTLTSTASWSNAATKIRSSEINLLKKNFKRASGLEAKRVIGGPSTEQWITQNAEVVEFAKFQLGGEALKRSYEDSRAFDLGGLAWSFDDSVYAPQATPEVPATVKGTAENYLVVAPSEADAGSVFALAEGIVHVPAGTQFAAAAPGTGMILQERGLVSWVAVVGTETGVPALRLFLRYAFLPILKVKFGAATFDPTVTA